jgi:hypothetical protein
VAAAAVHVLRIRAVEMVPEALEASGRRLQSLEPLGDLGFSQAHGLEE